MPGIDGFELLSAIRDNPKLRIIPVVVVSSSTNPEDVARAYALGANAYVAKPEQNFLDLVGDFDRFWLRRARLPRPKDSGEAL